MIKINKIDKQVLFPILALIVFVGAFYYVHASVVCNSCANWCGREICIERVANKEVNKQFGKHSALGSAMKLLLIEKMYELAAEYDKI